jgi:hypothetical protein
VEDENSQTESEARVNVGTPTLLVLSTFYLDRCVHNINSSAYYLFDKFLDQNTSRREHGASQSESPGQVVTPAQFDQDTAGPTCNFFIGMMTGN